MQTAEPQTERGSGESENEAHLGLTSLVLAVSVKNSGKSLNASMLLPSPGQKVKDGTDVCHNWFAFLCPRAVHL